MGGTAIAVGVRAWFEIREGIGRGREVSSVLGKKRRGVAGGTRAPEE